MRAKKIYYFIEFLSQLPLKKDFLFLSFFFSLSPASLLSSSFLLIFLSLPHLLSTSPIYFGSLSSPIFIVIAHVFAPRYRPISPSPPSHCSHNAKKPSPPSHRRSKLHRHRLHRTQERCGFRGWISWLWLDFMGFFGFRGFLWVS